MEKKVITLFYKDMNTSKVRAFIAKQESSGKTFEMILINENMIDRGQYTDEEKKILKEQIMVNYYLTLLQSGYELSQIMYEIDEGISMAQASPDLKEAISQLEIEKLLVEKASLLFSQHKPEETYVELDSTIKK